MGLDARKLVFGGLRTREAQSDQRLCYLIIGNTEYTLFFFLQQPGLHVIFNIESGQNVNRPVTTLGNIGDDAALLRRIDANISMSTHISVWGYTYPLMFPFGGTCSYVRVHIF